eukprot:502459_1
MSNRRRKNRKKNVQKINKHSKQPLKSAQNIINYVLSENNQLLLNTNEMYICVEDNTTQIPFDAVGNYNTEDIMCIGINVTFLRDNQRRQVILYDTRTCIDRIFCSGDTKPQQLWVQIRKKYIPKNILQAEKQKNILQKQSAIKQQDYKQPQKQTVIKCNIEYIQLNKTFSSAFVSHYPCYYNDKAHHKQYLFTMFDDNLYRFNITDNQWTVFSSGPFKHSNSHETCVMLLNQKSSILYVIDLNKSKVYLLDLSDSLFLLCDVVKWKCYPMNQNDLSNWTDKRIDIFWIDNIVYFYVNPIYKGEIDIIRQPDEFIRPTKLFRFYENGNSLKEIARSSETNAFRERWGGIPIYAKYLGKTLIFLHRERYRNKDDQDDGIYRRYRTTNVVHILCLSPLYISDKFLTIPFRRFCRVEFIVAFDFYIIIFEIGNYSNEIWWLDLRDKTWSKSVRICSIFEHQSITDIVKTDNNQVIVYGCLDRVCFSFSLYSTMP